MTKSLTLIIRYETADYQVIKKSYAKNKKKIKKDDVIRKKCLPLHRFNKQMIVLQI